jgi:DNA-binding NtrC family response regulator
VPALRERAEDIPLLADYFLKQHTRRYRKAIAGFDERATEALERHPWPGNVRELDHTIERAVLMAPGETIRVNDLGLNAAHDASARIAEMSLDEMECHLIRKALARSGGNVSHAAEALGLSRSALYRRIQRYGL